MALHRVKRFERYFLMLYISMDYLAIVVSFLLAYMIRRRAEVLTSLDLIEVPVLAFAWEDFLATLPWISLLWLGVFILTNRYQGIHRRRGIREFFSVFQGSSLGLLALIILGFFVGRQLFSRLMMVYAWLVSSFVLFGGRQLVHMLEQAFWKRGYGVYRVLLCGLDRSSRQLIEGIRQRGWAGYQLVGVLGQTEQLDAPTKALASGPIIAAGDNQVAGFPYLGSYHQLPKVLAEQPIDDLIIGLEPFDTDTASDLIKTAHEHNVSLLYIPDMLSLTASHKVTTTLNGIPLMGETPIPLRGLGALLKRLSDIIVSALGLLLLSPLFVLIALLVKLSSPGPVIFRQDRIGKDNTPFVTYKFRTMRTGSAEQTGKTWTTEGDQRRTRIGEFLRRSSLDELPQLWNILRGDMSLVGPRPEQPQFVETFSQVMPRYPERHRIRPGLTGWAQANGWRGNTSIEERLQYDLFYIENWSLLFDLRIIWQTIRQLNNAQGAY